MSLKFSLHSETPATEEENTTPDKKQSKYTIACTIASCSEVAEVQCDYSVADKAAHLSDYIPKKKARETGILSRIYLCSQHAKKFKPPSGWSMETKSAPEAFPPSPIPPPLPSSIPPPPPEPPKTDNTPLLDRAFANKRQ